MKALTEMNKTELRAACKEHGVTGYGNMDNAKMRDAIENARIDADLVKEYGTCTCPNCKTHLSNGVWNSNALVESHLHNGEKQSAKEWNEQLDKEFWCMACDNCFGEDRVPMSLAPKAKVAPVSEGLKIEKNRDEQNGIKRPSIGGLTRQVWDFCDTFFVQFGKIPSLKEAKDNSSKNNLNLVMTTNQYYSWRKFNGVTGRS